MHSFVIIKLLSGLDESLGISRINSINLLHYAVNMISIGDNCNETVPEALVQAINE